MMRRALYGEQGFTLVEMIVVIVITGIIAGMVAIFIRSPVQGYVDSARRAEMTDIADTALRRMARDIRTAVPNSVRLGGTTSIEFLPTSDGGRYRVDDNGGTLCGAAGDDLSFDSADSCFAIVGAPITFTAGDEIVVGSTQSDGNAAYDKTSSVNASGVVVGGVLRDYTGPVGSQSIVKMAGAAQFPASSELDGHRFEVVPGNQQAVTYACTGTLGPLDANGDGQGVLRRFWLYGFNTTQVALPGGTSAILADKLSACSFVYDTSNQRNSLVAISLTITRGGESVTLYHEIHVNNIP